MSAIIGSSLLLYVIIKKQFQKNYAAVFLTYSLLIQASHGFFEGSKSVDFHNFTGLIYVLAGISYNGNLKKWLIKFFPVQILAMLAPLFFKDTFYFNSVAHTVDHFSLLISGFIIGSCAAFLTSSRYLYMRKYLIERDEKYTLAKQVSHDLRSPLEFIRDALKDEDISSSTKKKIIEMSLMRIDSISQQLYSKTKDFGKFDFYDIFEQVKKEKESNLLKRKLNLNFEIALELKGGYPKFSFDDIVTALSNIIDNAADASKPFSSIEVKVLQQKCDLVIFVEDAGGGIPTEIVSFIFNKDFTYKKSKGSGLGLYQAKCAVEEVKGTLQLISNTEVGATFKIYLPNVFDADNLSLSSQIVGNKPSETLKVVLIDDDRFIRINWSMYCHERGIEFQSFESVDQFVNQKDKIDKNSKIFIDSSLKHDQRGELESEVIYKEGFKNLYLSTGFNSSEINAPEWILNVFSKSPTCIHSIN